MRRGAGEGDQGVEFQAAAQRHHALVHRDLNVVPGLPQGALYDLLDHLCPDLCVAAQERDEQVGPADHSGETPLLVDDRQALEVSQREGPCGLGDAAVRHDRHGRAAHQLTGRVTGGLAAFRALAPAFEGRPRLR